MALKDILLKLMSRDREPEEEIPDDETRDRFLRSLRRQRRTQMEKIEKRELIQKIADFERNEVRVNIFGIKDKFQKREQLTRVIQKKKQIRLLKEQNKFKIQKTMIQVKKKKETGFMAKTEI